MKIKQKKIRGGGEGEGLPGGGGQGGCERRSDFFVKILKNKSGVSGRGGGQGGCERRIEVFVKIRKKKSGGGSAWGVRVDVNE